MTSPRFGVVEAGFLGALAVAVIWALALFGCAHVVPPPAPVPVAVDGGAFSCTTACENIFSLGCTGAMPECVPACENVQSSGVFSYDVACISRAYTCDQVTACQSAPTPK